jgi:hypothetical protein
MTENYSQNIQLFEEFPNIMRGIQLMSRMWESNKRLLKPGKNSIEFVYKGSSSAQNHVFRIERIPKDSPPKLMAYSGDPPQSGPQRRPGSPLISSATQAERDKLKNDFGILPVYPDETGDWRKDLEEDTPKEFYTDFIEHAMRMCNRKR